ncbi:MAG: hypothetical protein ACXW2E_00785 [Nitrososphaeraceae archaeon]
MLTEKQKKILELFEKYENQTMERFKQVCEEDGYVPNKNFDEMGIWDEILCRISDFDFLNEIRDGIEDSVSLEEYGFDYNEESND